MTVSAQRQRRTAAIADENAADDAMISVDPDASDETIAGVVADYLVASLPSSRFYHLSVIHDVRPSTLRRLERIRESMPDYCGGDPDGPCPFPYDWTRKNVVGISTRDRDRARQWIIEATLAGYCVHRHQRRDSWGCGRGSLADIRERRREAIAISREREAAS